jgi:hypothetical protein
VDTFRSNSSQIIHTKRLIVSMVLISASNPAFGHRIFQGRDLSNTFAVNGYSDFGLRACDREADGNGVYALAYAYGPNPSVRDWNGSKRGCGNWRNTTRIQSHQTCEDRFWNDACSRMYREP